MLILGPGQACLALHGVRIGWVARRCAYFCLSSICSSTVGELGASIQVRSSDLRKLTGALDLLLTTSMLLGTQSRHDKARIRAQRSRTLGRVVLCHPSSCYNPDRRDVWPLALRTRERDCEAVTALAAGTVVCLPLALALYTPRRSEERQGPVGGRHFTETTSWPPSCQQRSLNAYVFTHRSIRTGTNATHSMPPAQWDV